MKLTLHGSAFFTSFLPLLLTGTTFLGAFGLAGCADERKEGVPRNERGPALGALDAAASESGVDVRYLVTAAYVQSNFAADAGRKDQGPQTAERDPVFGMPLAGQPAGTPDTLAARAKVLASKIAAKAQKLSPANSFDWLLCTAQAIVGDTEKDPNVRDFQVRLVLLQLIDSFNGGFAVLAPGSQAPDVVPPAPEKDRVDVKALDAGRARYVTGFRFDRDVAAELLVASNPDVVAGVRASSAFPKVLLRHCPGNALSCFDHFRKSKDTGAHFLVYRTSQGRLELVQFHDIAKDLNWYGKTQEDAIVLVVAGLSGVEPSTARTDWLDWEDYVSLRRILVDVIGQSARTLRADIDDNLQGNAFKPAFLDATVKELFKEPEATASTPKSQTGGQSAFLLPVTWDSGLFREILKLPTEPRLFGQIRVDAPKVGQSYNGNRAFFAFYPDTEAAEIQLFQDKAGTPGNPWDLILKRDYSPAQQRFDYTHEFRRKGVTGNNVRSVKIVARAADGRVLGTRIVRFALTGIEK
ncbi:MAG: hypothetical protein IOD12_02275 [Silvanigrellales bacterium]|nr:hypothetical protein [Silvanigrellales bacterium]